MYSCEKLGQTMLFAGLSCQTGFHASSLIQIIVTSHQTVGGVLQACSLVLQMVACFANSEVVAYFNFYL